MTNKTLIIISIASIIVFLIIALFTSSIIPSTMQVDISKLLEIIGILTTCIAFAIGSYLIVLAINAYSHLLKIQSIEKDTQSIFFQIREYENITKEAASDVIESIEMFLSSQIDYIENIPISPAYREEMEIFISKQINDVQAQRARILIKYKMMDKEKRIKYINELSQLGFSHDIEPLQKISLNVNESTIVRKCANRAIEILLERKDRGRCS